nr:MAG TPA: hypothetical protein [Crassvirales sp.]
MNNTMSISKYCYGEIKKIVNGNEYQIGYITCKVDPLYNGKPDNKTIDNNGFATSYCLYKNNKGMGSAFGRNLTKEELLNRFNKLIEYYENN